FSVWVPRSWVLLFALAREFHRLRLGFRIIGYHQGGRIRYSEGRRERNSDRAFPACRQRCIAAIRHAERTARSAEPLHQHRKTGLLLAALGVAHGDILGSLLTPELHRAEVQRRRTDLQLDRHWRRRGSRRGCCGRCRSCSCGCGWDYCGGSRSRGRGCCGGSRSCGWGCCGGSRSRGRGCCGGSRSCGWGCCDGSPSCSRCRSCSCGWGCCGGSCSCGWCGSCSCGWGCGGRGGWRRCYIYIGIRIRWRIKLTGRIHTSRTMVVPTHYHVLVGGCGVGGGGWEHLLPVVDVSLVDREGAARESLCLPAGSWPGCECNWTTTKCHLG